MGLSIENGRDGPVCCAVLGSTKASQPAGEPGGTCWGELIPHPALLAAPEERQGGETEDNSSQL